MKRKITMLIAILLLTSACSGSALKSINIKNLKNMINDKKTFILYLTDESTEGNVLKKNLKEVSNDYKITSYYLNTKKLNDNEKNDLENLITYKDTNIIIFIKKGNEETVLTRINDVYITRDKLKNELKIQGYIK